MRVRRFHRTWRASLMAGALGMAGPLWALAQGTPAFTAAMAPQQRIEVTQWRVTGNTLLPEADLQSALARFNGQRTLAELTDAAQVVQALYSAAGYGGVVAYLPPQTVEGGTVTIAVVEGKLAAVQVHGNQHFNDDNIRASLPSLQTGATPNLKRLDAEIELANENPAKQVRVLLLPGAQPGESAARVGVVEQPVQRWTVSADNTGNEATGRTRANLGWQHADLSGHDDVLTAQFTTAPANPGRVKALSAGYHLPLYRDLGTLDAYAGYSDIDNGNTPTAAGDLRFSGRGRALGLRLTRHLLRNGEVSPRVSVGLDYRAYLNQCAITGLPDGACGPAGESVAVQPLTVEYAEQGGGRMPWTGAVSLAANLQLGAGMNDEAHFAAVRNGATPSFVVMRANGSVQVPLGAGWRVQARAAGQMTGDALVPGEQFGIGGISSVRGYDERELAGDRGAAATLEVVTPDWSLASGRVEGLAFADGGWVDNLLSAPCLGNRLSCHLYGAGLGARWSLGGLQGKLYVAEALSQGATTQRHHARVHFSLAYGF